MRQILDDNHGSILQDICGFLWQMAQGRWIEDKGSKMAAFIADLITYFPLSVVGFMRNSELLRQQDFFDMLYTATVGGGSNGDNIQLIFIHYNDFTTSLWTKLENRCTCYYA